MHGVWCECRLRVSPVACLIDRSARGQRVVASCRLGLQVCTTASIANDLWRTAWTAQRVEPNLAPKKACKMTHNVSVYD